MAKWARIVDGLVFETTNHEPGQRYAPELVFIPVPDEVGQNWLANEDGTFSPPPVEPAPSE